MRYVFPWQAYPLWTWFLYVTWVKEPCGNLFFMVRVLGLTFVFGAD